MKSNTREITEEMLDLLTKELALNGVEFQKHPWLSSENIIREVSMTLIPEVHEGKINSYGILFVENLADLENVDLIQLPQDQIGLTRKLADGERWFVLYEKDQFIGLADFKIPLNTEIQFIRNFPIAGGLAVQRSSAGVTKFFQGDSLTIHDNRRWFTKPNVKTAAWKVSQCVANIDKKTLNLILEFAFHLVSPTTRVGAILVWFLKPIPSQLRVDSEEKINLRSLNLSIANDAHTQMICHLLSQVDGATYLDSDGTLMETGVQLKYSEASRKLVSEFQGTRHTSSLRFSYDVEDAIIVTISEDGPVTVFSSGASIADLQIYSAHKMARLLRSELPERGQQITSSSFEVVCTHCQKCSMIEEVQLEGYNLERTSLCPICKNDLYSSKCFSLEVRPFKRLRHFAPA